MSTETEARSALPDVLVKVSKLTEIVMGMLADKAQANGLAAANEAALDILGGAFRFIVERNGESAGQETLSFAAKLLPIMVKLATIEREGSRN